MIFSAPECDESHLLGNMWEHSRFGTTAAQRAGLALDSWTWNDFATFPCF